MRRSLYQYVSCFIVLAQRLPMTRTPLSTEDYSHDDLHWTTNPHSPVSNLAPTVNCQKPADSLSDTLPYTAGISCWDHRSQVKNIEETSTGCLNPVAPLFSLTICRTGKRYFLNVVFLGSVIPGPNPHCDER